MAVDHQQQTRVVVSWQESAQHLIRRAESLAGRLSLPLVEPQALPRSGTPEARQSCQTIEPPAVILLVTAQGLALKHVTTRGTEQLRVDFVGGATDFRRRRGGSKGQLIARAVGVGDRPPRVLDVTAGLGRDAFVLAGLGCHVVALERSPVLTAVVQDGIGRGRVQGTAATREALGRLKLHRAEAMTLLRSGTVEPDCIPDGDAADADRSRSLRDVFDVAYIDPMYPPRKKSAAIKKDMRICRALVGDDPDAGALLHAALSSGMSRIVVKRPIDAEQLAPGPDMVYRSPQTRYDVYQPGAKGCGKPSPEQA